MKEKERSKRKEVWRGVTVKGGNEGKEGKGENECIRGRETLPSSGNTPTIVCSCMCAHVCVCLCASCASAKPTHPQAVDLYILFGLSVCPNIIHPPSSPPPIPPPPHSPSLTGLTLMGVEAAEGVGTVNRTKPPF